MDTQKDRQKKQIDRPIETYRQIDLYVDRYRKMYDTLKGYVIIDERCK